MEAVNGFIEVIVRIVSWRHALTRCISSLSVLSHQSGGQSGSNGVVLSLHLRNGMDFSSF